ncbi:hypothetical protein DFH11DRAFT_841989 [Phellopilus nigrolimitatus]|nr:hypothetical protein DFH11DRAFT_841989 [Phellopilus nigrolimitatus]
MQTKRKPQRRLENCCLVTVPGKIAILSSWRRKQQNMPVHSDGKGDGGQAGCRTKRPGPGASVKLLLHTTPNHGIRNNAEECVLDVSHGSANRPLCDGRECIYSENGFYDRSFGSKPLRPVSFSLGHDTLSALWLATYDNLGEELLRRIAYYNLVWSQNLMLISKRRSIQRRPFDGYLASAAIHKNAKYVYFNNFTCIQKN